MYFILLSKLIFINVKLRNISKNIRLDQCSIWLRNKDDIHSDKGKVHSVPDVWLRPNNGHKPNSRGQSQYGGYGESDIRTSTNGNCENERDTLL